MLSDSLPIKAPSIPPRLRGRVLFVPAVIALLAGTLHASTEWELTSEAPIAPMDQPQDVDEAASLQELLTTLRDPAADRAARDAAAEALVKLAQRPQGAAAATEILLSDQHAEARVVILRAIGRTWNPPDRLFPPLADLARSADAQRAALVMPAIAAYATREAARLLVEQLAPERPAAVRDAAAASLARMTGRDDFRSNPIAWEAWLRDAGRLSESEWRDLLAQGVWRRADRVDADRRAIAERLAETFRRLYIATPADDRPRLLSQMMLDSRPEIRDVGLEIVSRELAGGKSMDGPITDAAVRLLRSEDARVRTRAAALVSQLNPAATAAAVAEALRDEFKPDAAAALLQAVARAPHGDAQGAVLQWLSIAETRPQAIDAALALSRAGHLQDPNARGVLLDALRSAEPLRLSASGVRLLATIGDDDDHARIAELLSAPVPASRLAAAEVLAEVPGFVDVILAAARQDPALFASAVRSVSLWEPTLAGARAISELAGPTPEEYRAGILRIAEALTLSDLLAMASSTASDLALREAMLERAADRPMGPFLPEQEEDLAAVGECILLLAETRLALKRPDLALQAIEAMPSAWEGSTSARATSVHVIALLWTNRIETAAQIDAPASVWLDALEYALEEDHAAAILDAIRARFEHDLDAEALARLEALAEAVTLRRQDHSTEPIPQSG